MFKIFWSGNILYYFSNNTKNNETNEFLMKAQKNRKQAEESDSFLKFASQNDTKEEDDFVMV